MSSVDDRIVNMQFNNKQFTEGVTQSQKSLDGLEQSLQKTAKSQGLASLDQQVGGLRQKFSLMQVAGVSAVATIASKATSAGLNLVKSLAIDPILQGWDEYNTNLTSIQTVMANTGKGIKPVQDALNQLNHYSDLTIYNFSEMARNVGTFTAAGVGLKTSVAAIQGISNMAALSGSSSQQASMAMYQLSQAIAAGRVNLQDWNSVVNAGMGGKNLQRALIQTGQAMGTLNGKTVTMGRNIKIAGQSFRESISSKPGGGGWLTSDVLVKTLSIMDGRLSKTALTSKYMATQQYTLAEATAKADADLKKQQKTLAKQGFNKEQIKNLTSMAERAQQSATVVKTLPQLMGVVKESIGSVWSNAFTNIVGNFNQSKKLWTNASNAISKITQNFNNGFTTMIVNWKREGGRLAFIDAIKTGFKDVGLILKTVGQAFRDVFPSHEGQGLASFSKMLQTLAHALTPTAKTLDSLRNIFGGLFAVLHIGFTIVKAVSGALFGLFGGISKGSGKAGGGILAFAGHIGELLMKFDKFISSGNVLVKVFNNIGRTVGKTAGKFIGIGTNIVEGLIQGLGGGALSALKGAVEKLANYIPDRIKAILGIHSPAQTMIPIGENIIQGIVVGIDHAIRFIIQAIGQIGSAIFGGIRDELGNMSPLDFASLLNTLFAGGVLLASRNLLTSFKNIGSSISGTFGQLQKSIKTFQNGIRAKALKDIAISVGILTASLVALTFLDPKKLSIGLGGLAGMMSLLVGSLATLSKVSKGEVGIVKLATSMTLIAAAMTMLSTAIVILGHQDLGTLAKGLGSLAIAMGIMTVALRALGGAGKISLGTGPAILLIAAAMNILAGAIALFGHMDIKTLAKGLGTMGFAMGIMSANLALLGLVGKSALAGATSILLVSGAMVVLSGAILAFGKMNLKTLAKGLAVFTYALGAMTASMMGLALLGPATFGAAAAILAMATAMVMLVPVIATLGNMDIGTLAKGIVAFAAIIVIFSAAIALLGAVAMEVGPGLLMLGGALALIGLGMAAFGTGFALLAATGTAGIAVMTAAITAFIMLLPSIAIQMAAALVTFLETIAAAAPRVRAAMGTLFAQMLGVVTDAIPQIGALISKLIAEIIRIVVDAIPEIGHIFSALIKMGIDVIKRAVPQFVEAGYTIIDKFIGSVAKHVPNIVREATDLIVGFLRAIGSASGRVAEAGFKMIIDFINGIARAIDNNSGKLRSAGLNLARSIIDGMTGGLLSEGLAAVRSAAQRVADALPGWMKKVLHINSPSKVMRDEVGYQAGAGVAQGLDASSRTIESSARSLGHKVVKGVSDGISQNLKDAVNAAVRMANAVVAAGDPGVLAAANVASNAQGRADYLQAQADLAAADAKKVNPKKNKKLAAKLKRAADRAQKAADAAQAQADASAQNVTDLKDFNSADLHTKGDKMNEQAQSLAEQAQKIMEKANAEAAKAIALGKGHAKEARRLRQQAQADALEAARLANAAQAANAQANAYYGQEVMARVEAITAAREAEKKAAADQAAYEAADTQGKIDILNKKITEMQALSDKRNADAAALLDKARAEAYSNAAQAMADLDASEQAAQDAKDAADAAQQTKDQLAQLMGGDSGLSVGGSSGGSTIQPSQSILEDAASAIDRYTASLVAAQEAMNAQQPVIQFEQNNYSPEALSASEIYRQTHNLLSTKEVKMGAN